jgi:crossover junction endodeoxyribonuclease RusA
LTVLLIARPPDRRRRDLDNLAKAVLDGMNGVLYDDDSQIDNLIIRRGGPMPGGLVEVVMWPCA